MAIDFLNVTVRFLHEVKEFHGSPHRKVVHLIGSLVFDHSMKEVAICPFQTPFFFGYLCGSDPSNSTIKHTSCMKVSFW